MIYVLCNYFINEYCGNIQASVFMHVRHTMYDIQYTTYNVRHAMYDLHNSRENYFQINLCDKVIYYL